VDDLDFSSQPNDAYFKQVFSDPQRAALFFQSHLDAGLVALIDWSSLKLEPGSFVKQSLQQTHSDLLFTARLGEREVKLYLLFEHQTTVETEMPLRVLGYELEIMQAHYKRHGLPLPPVLAFVLHQGPERWTVSPCFEDMFELSDAQAGALLPYLPKFRHELLDLTQLDPDRDEDHAQLRVVLQLMKLARQKRLAEFLVWIADEMQRQGWNVPEPLLLLSYLYAMHADATIDEKQIAHSLEGNPNLKENIMSLAERLIARGEARGEARGTWIGKIQMLEQLLDRGVTSEAALHAMSADDLKARFSQLEQDYNACFKKS
jgi:predicted transposase/invertase (TIGR01784 family)